MTNEEIKKLIWSIMDGSFVIAGSHIRHWLCNVALFPPNTEFVESVTFDENGLLLVVIGIRKPDGRLIMKHSAELGAEERQSLIDANRLASEIEAIVHNMSKRFMVSLIVGAYSFFESEE